MAVADRELREVPATDQAIPGQLRDRSGAAMTDDLDVIAVHLATRAPGPRNLDDLYHSTFYAGVFPYEEWTHFGTWAAAENRARDIRQSYGLPENTPVTVHTAWLRGRVYPHVLTDEQVNDIWGTGYVREIDEGLPSGQGYHIFPYRNDSEDPGSISYLAQRSAIHVIGTESIPRDGGPSETALRKGRRAVPPDAGRTVITPVDRPASRRAKSQTSAPARRRTP